MDFFIAILCFLAVLAVFDLFVGVSNDAINFLSSAIGSRAASLRTIMIVASLGVLLGATFSNGMMSIARSGVFNPQMFTYHDIMFIFFSVVCSDILLLNTFNSLGLPTSTTVSIICELLGGATAAAAVKLLLTGGSLLFIGDYINSSKVLSIISAILSSVVIAFITGTVVQYLTRLVFTFSYLRMYRRAGAIFGAMAITIIFYFLVMKGARGSVFMTPELMAFLDSWTSTILLGLFFALAVIFHALISFFHLNIFKVIILSGTFALAFSFAGNDLVNFVGVPLAALDSYMQFSAAPGALADTFTMEGLRNTVKTPTFFLVLSGSIMVVTLWVSKSAHNVIKTSINLSSSHADKEQFGSSTPARLIVRSGLAFSRGIRLLIPENVKSRLASRMVKPAPRKTGPMLPFDQVRASINLIVASILIACATSLALPLSTTYVCVMVAMGSSLADGAWDRESAVYRVTGVLTVVSGWFLTAFSAFTICAVITSLNMLGGPIVIGCFMLLVVFVIVRSNFTKRRQQRVLPGLLAEDADVAAIRANIQEAIVRNLVTVIDLLDRAMAALFAEDSRQLGRIRNEVIDFDEDIRQWRAQYYMLAHGGDGTKAYTDARHIYYRVATNMKDVSYQLRLLAASADNHVADQHSVHPGQLQRDLRLLTSLLQELARTLSHYLDREVLNREDILLTSNAIADRVNHFQLELLQRIDAEDITPRSSELYMSFLQFAKEVINRWTMCAIMMKHLNLFCLYPTAPDVDQGDDAPVSRLTLVENAAGQSLGERPHDQFPNA